MNGKLLKVVKVGMFFLYVQTSLFAQTKKIDAIAIPVDDMEKSVSFYGKVLGFKIISDIEMYGETYEKLQGLFGLRMRKVRMQLGDEYIELIDYLTSGGRPISAEAKSNDLSFQHIAIVVSDMDKAYELLRKFNVTHVSTGPQTIPASNIAAAGIKAFYFQDPDKHNLELIYFPKGKGQEKWQNSAGKIFLGIDHTAISVSNSEQSHAFYQELLGISRKGDSWNKGTEQEHLNNIENASLHITGYRTNSGPGIEFLQYLVPGPGRPYPIDTRSDDLWNWQTILVVDDIASVYNRLKEHNYSFVSKEIVSLNKPGDEHGKAFVTRDPDGHAILILQANQ